MNRPLGEADLASGFGLATGPTGERSHHDTVEVDPMNGAAPPQATMPPV